MFERWRMKEQQETKKAEKNFWEGLIEYFIPPPPPPKRLQISGPKNLQPVMTVTVDGKIGLAGEKTLQAHKEFIEAYVKHLQEQENNPNKVLTQDTCVDVLGILEPIRQAVLSLISKNDKSQFQGENIKDTVKKISSFLLNNGKDFFLHTDPVLHTRAIMSNVDCQDMKFKDFSDFKAKIEDNIPISQDFIKIIKGGTEQEKIDALQKQLALYGVFIPAQIYNRWLKFPRKKEPTVTIEQENSTQKLDSKNIQLPTGLRFFENGKDHPSNQKQIRLPQELCARIATLFAGQEKDSTTINVYCSEIVKELGQGSEDFSTIIIDGAKDKKSAVMLRQEILGIKAQDETGAVRKNFIENMTADLTQENMQKKVDSFNKRLGLHGLFIPEKILLAIAEDKLQLKK